jgi:phage-related protein
MYNFLVDETIEPLRWLESSRKDVRAFPPEVRRDVGYALYAAQRGATDPAAKPVKGLAGASGMEIVAPFAGDTWRAVYTVRFEDAFTCCTPSRRSRRRESPRLRRMST